LGRRRAAVGQGHLDLERIAPIDGRRRVAAVVKLGRHHVVQAFQEKRLADRERQSVAGAEILVAWIAWNRASASWRPIVAGRAAC